MTAPPATKWAIKLHWSEIRFAGIVGVERMVWNLATDHDDARGRHSRRDKDRIPESHVNGCIGELALAKMRNCFWSGSIGNYSVPDVGRYQVRATTYPQGALTLHREDKARQPFVLVRLALPWVTACGWCYAEDGQKDEYWEDRGRINRPAFYVPDGILLPMEELPEYPREL